MMQSTQKILMFCLITGIIISSLTSCKAKIDLGCEAHWHYVNETQQTITVMCGDKSDMEYEEDFILNPGEEYTFRMYGFTHSSNMSAEDFGGAPYCRAGATIIIGDNDPVYYTGRGPLNKNAKLETVCNIENYSAEKLDTNKFRFTYIFK